MPDLRHLEWDACQNARDVGGLPTGDGGLTRPRALLRADNSCRLTEAGLAAVRAHGVATVVDLRSDGELRRFPSPLARAAGLAYVHAPALDDGDRAGADEMEAASTLVEIYRVIVARSQRPLAGAVRAIATAAPGGVLVHCHAGKDRTGLVVALALAAVGVPGPAIADDYAASGPRLQRHFADELEDPALDGERRARLRSLQHARPETIAAALDLIDEGHGGADGYLRGGGMTEAELARLRERLVEPG